MKKALFTIGFIVFAIISYAQPAVQQADRAFASGNYSDATQLYEMAASTVTGNEAERKRLYDAANKCRKIIALHAKANSAYQARNYGLAMASYNEILKYNPRDSRANARMREYTAVRENSTWEKVLGSQTFAEKVARAKEYVNQYSSGRYREEANQLIGEEELWQKAYAEDTYAAYQTYLQNSILKIYQAEAKDAILKIDDRLWAAAKRKNTPVAYLDYLSVQTPRKGRYLAEAQGMYNLLRARDLFNKKEYVKAYDYFVAAGNYVTEFIDTQRVNICLEYIYYKKACSSSGTIYDCDVYLNKYNYRAEHFAEVEDQIMYLLCKEGRFEEAMKYAKFKSEEKYVKQAKKAWKKAHK